LPCRRIVVVGNFAYSSSEELAGRYGVGANEFESLLKLPLEDGVVSLSKVLRDIPGKELSRFSLSRMLLAAGESYVALRTIF